MIAKPTPIHPDKWDVLAAMAISSFLCGMIIAGHVSQFSKIRIGDVGWYPWDNLVRLELIVRLSIKHGLIHSDDDSSGHQRVWLSDLGYRETRRIMEEMAEGSFGEPVEWPWG